MFNSYTFDNLQVEDNKDFWNYEEFEQEKENFNEQKYV